MWKLLTAAGIIGIGTLVVLEVQNRLPSQSQINRHAQAAASGSPTESDVIPDATTDLDRMLAGDSGMDDAQFALNEPNVPNDPGPLAPPAEEIEIVAEAAIVDRTVLKDSLTDDANLFDRSVDADQSQRSENVFSVAEYFEPVAEPIKTVSYSPEPATDKASQANVAPTVVRPGKPTGTPTGKSTTQFFNGNATPATASPTATARSAATEQTALNGQPAAASVTAVTAAPVATPHLDALPGHSQALNSNAATSPGLMNSIQPTTAQVHGDARATTRVRTAARSPNTTNQADEPLEPFIPDELPVFGGLDTDAPDTSKPSTPRNVPAEDTPLMELPGFDTDETKEFEFTPDPQTPARPKPGTRLAPPIDDEKADFFDADQPVPTPPAGNSGGRPRSRPNEQPALDEFPETNFPPTSPRPTPREVPNDEFPEPTFPDRKSVPSIDEDAPFGSNSDRNNGLADPYDLPAVNDRPARSTPGRSRTGSDNSSERTVSEVMRPQLSIQKRAPDTATVGVAHEYTIVVTNDGDSAAYDVIIDDELGNGARLENSKPTADFDRVSGKLSWTIRELAPRQKQEIVVRITPTGEGTLDGMATVRFKAQVKSATVITAPKLTLEMTGPAAVKVGDEVELRYVIRNNGSGDASNVILRSVLPPGLKHSEGGDLEYEIENLPSGGREVIDLTVIAAEPGSYHTVSEVTASGVSADKASTDINIIGSQLTIQRLGPDRRFVGRSGTFQNIISNETAFEATNAIVVEQVPEGMRFVSADNGGTYNPQNGRVRWDIDRLAPEKQITLEIELEAISAGPQEALVEVTESAGFRSQARAAVTVEDFENMTANISRQDKPVAIGESFGFTITIENRGTAVAKNVDMVIEVPAEISVKAAGTREVKARLVGNTVRYATVEAIQPGDKMTFELKLQGEQQARNARVLASLSYDQMPKPLIVSEAVTIFDDSP